MVGLGFWFSAFPLHPRGSRSVVHDGFWVEGFSLTCRVYSHLGLGLRVVRGGFRVQCFREGVRVEGVVGLGFRFSSPPCHSC